VKPSGIACRTFRDFRDVAQIIKTLKESNDE